MGKNRNRRFYQVADSVVSHGVKQTATHYKRWRTRPAMVPESTFTDARRQSVETLQN